MVEEIVVQEEVEDEQTTTEPAELSYEDLNKLIVESEEEGAVEQEVTPEAEGTVPEVTSTPKENTAPSLEDIVKRVAELEELKEKLSAQNFEKEIMIRRQAAELGDLRKKAYQPLTDEEKLALRDKVYEDPEEAVSEIIARMAQKKEAETLEKTSKQEENKQTIKQVVPEIEELLPEIAALARAEGFPENNIKHFEAHPWDEPPALLIGFAQKVKNNRKVAMLEAELAKLKGSSKSIVSRIASTTRSSVINDKSASPSTREIRTPSHSQFAQMSPAELDEFLAQNK